MTGLRTVAAFVLVTIWLDRYLTLPAAFGITAAITLTAALVGGFLEARRQRRIQR